MKTIKRTVPILLMLVVFMAGLFVGPAFADLESDLTLMQDRVLSLALPIGVIVLIFTGILMMLGKTDAVKPALFGLIFIFAASAIVLFISSIFG